jgi:O-antigen/teichoic acid export membrane protein
MLSRLASHVSVFTLGSVLVTFAGLISFPILTRLLSVEEYGVMNLIFTALALLVGLGKLGVQHSAVRFYSEVRAGKHAADLAGYAATVVLGMGAVGLVTALLWAGISQWLPQSLWSDARVAPLMLLTSVLVLLRVLDSALLNQLRAQERSVAMTVYGVIKRYASLALVLAALFFVARGLWGFFGATILAESLALLGLAVWMFRREPLKPRTFSPALFRAMLAFGIPMLGYELASVVMSMGDRYVIQNTIGAAPLGVYAASYNLCDYVRIVVFSSFATAVLPMYPRIWEESGQQATVDFLQGFLRSYVMAAMFAIAVMSAVGSELLAFLASAKYRDGATVVPWVISGMALEGIVMVMGAGLYLDKRSRTIMLLVACCAVLNITLNLLLVPRLGITGSAMANLLSYASLLVLSMWMGRKRLPLSLPYGALLKFGAFAALAYGVAASIRVDGDFPTLVIRSAASTAVYGALVLAFDEQGRTILRSAWQRISAKLA